MDHLNCFESGTGCGMPPIGCAELRGISPNALYVLILCDSWCELLPRTQSANCWRLACDLSASASDKSSGFDLLDLSILGAGKSKLLVNRGNVLSCSYVTCGWLSGNPTRLFLSTTQLFVMNWTPWIWEKRSSPNRYWRGVEIATWTQKSRHVRALIALHHL